MKVYKIRFSPHRKKNPFYICVCQPTRYFSIDGNWYSKMSVDGVSQGGTYFNTEADAQFALSKAYPDTNTYTVQK